MNRLILLLCVTGLLSCEKENMGDCFKSTGKLNREERPLVPFRALELNDRINLFVTYSPELKLEVEAGENLQEFIFTEVTENTLIIRNDNRCNWVRSFKKDVNVYLSTPELKVITYYGSGEINFLNTFQTDTLLLNMWEASGDLSLKVESEYVELKSNTGPATIFCEGSSTELIGFMGATGKIDATQTISQFVLAVSTSTGQLKVNANDFMKADISSVGNIEYTGSPIIELIKTGKGELIKIDN